MVVGAEDLYNGFSRGYGACSPWKIFENWNLSQFPAHTYYAFIYQKYPNIADKQTANHVVHTFLLPQQDLFTKTVPSITFLNCP